LLSENAVDRFNALHELALWLATEQTTWDLEAAPPDVEKIISPDIYQSFFGEHRADALRKSLVEAGPALQNNVATIFDAGGTALSKLRVTTHQAAIAAAAEGSTAQYRRFAKGAADLSEAAFGAQDYRAHLKVSQEPAADAFALWLAGSGFQIVEKALGYYVQEMIRYWKHEAANPEPEHKTSPHILARRAQLERVRSPRMVVRVGEGRELDKALALEIGDRIRGGVAKAFGQAVAQPAAAG
jgi:hypothetical protein